jgi:hypothetical protein
MSNAHYFNVYAGQAKSRDVISKYNAKDLTGLQKIYGYLLSDVQMVNYFGLYTYMPTLTQDYITQTRREVNDLLSQAQSMLNEITNYVNRLNNLIPDLKIRKIRNSSDWETQSTTNLRTNLTNAINNMFVLLSNKNISSSNIIGKDINNNNVSVTKLQIILYPKCGQKSNNGLHIMPQINDSSNPGIMLGMGNYVLETIINSNRTPIKKIGAIYIPYGLQVELYQTCNFSNSGNSIILLENNACINNEKNIDFTIASLKVSVLSSLNKTIIDNIIFTNQYNKIFGSINITSTVLTLYLTASYQDYINIFALYDNNINSEIIEKNMAPKSIINSSSSAISLKNQEIVTLNQNSTDAKNFILASVGQNNTTYYDYDWSQHSVYDRNAAQWTCGSNVVCHAPWTCAGRGNDKQHTWYGRGGWAYYPECKKENDNFKSKRKALLDNATTIETLTKEIADLQAIINTENTKIKPQLPKTNLGLTTIEEYASQYLPEYIKTLNDPKKIDIINKIIASKLSNIDDIYNAWML